MFWRSFCGVLGQMKEGIFGERIVMNGGRHLMKLGIAE